MKLKAEMPLATLVVVTLLRVIKSYPLDLLPVGSSDYAAHLFRVWYIINHGITGWNPLWYGGFPFLKIEMPFTYMLASLLGLLVGLVAGLNLVADLAWILLPLVFYLFLREYMLSDAQLSLALVLFSTLPHSLTYFRNGNVPFTLALFFSIVFWRSFKRHLDKKEGPLFSIVFLSATALTHVFMFASLLVGVSVWFLTAYASKENIKRAALIVLSTSILIAFWYIPFFSSIYVGREGSVSLVSDPVSATVRTATQRLDTMRIPQWSFALAGMLIGVSFLLSLWRRGPLLREFLPLLLISSAFFLVLNYKRMAVIVSVPLSILAAQPFQGRLERYWPAVAASSFLLLAFFSMPFSPLSSFPASGERAILYPLSSGCEGCTFYDGFLIPYAGGSYMDGWFPQSQNVPALAVRKLPYLEKMRNPLVLQHQEFEKLAEAGMLNHIIVNSRYDDYVSYFDSHGRFARVKEEDGFILYASNPSFTYIDVNGSPADADVTRGRDRIGAVFQCSPSTITVKETYDRDWRITINGQPMNQRPNAVGFIEFDSGVDGICSLEMVYKRRLLPLYG